MTSTLKTIFSILPLAVFWALPLAAGLIVAVSFSFDPSAWTALLSHPQFWPALRLSLFSGTASLVLSVPLAFWIAADFHRPDALHGLMGGFLALPHLAFAVGFGFLITPSGLLARAVGTAAGWAVPPQWVTTQDPLGLSLVAVLVLKEVPFIVWLIAGIMAQRDFAQMTKAQFRIGRSLGHGNRSIWLRVFAPQILQRMRWPLLVVWAYGATVVDVALAIGPTQPPPLAVLVWFDLNNVDQTLNARGTAGALFLTAMLAVIATLAWELARLLVPVVKRFIVRGPTAGVAPLWNGKIILCLFAAIYGLTGLMLAIMSISPLWPFPDLWPTQFRVAAWAEFFAAPAPMVNSLSFAAGSTFLALTLAVAWFETMHEKFDRYLLASAGAALVLPALLIADGQYLLFLRLGLNGTWAGVFLAHLTPVFAYVFIVLKGPYRAFDPRFRSVSLGLNASTMRFWAAVKMPLLKPVLLAAAAIGIGVGVGQYVAVQLVASGRHSTLAIEAVTLASGGSRQLLAVYSLALMAIPLLAFVLASRFERSWP